MMEINKTQFEALEKYEQYFLTALRSNYPRSPGRRGLQEMHAILREIEPTTPALNTTCGTCILRVLKKVGTLYFDYKEAHQPAPVENIEEKAEIKPVKAAAKKNTATSRKAPRKASRGGKKAKK